MTRRRRAHARPRELLDAALAVFVEKGFAGARTDEIAARAGVSKGTLYVYFRSKEDLLKALIDERFSSRITMRAHETTSDAQASQELLRDALATWRSAFSQAHAGEILKLVVTEAHAFPQLAEFWLRDVIEPVCRLISGIVVRGIARGEFRPVDPDLVVHALVLPVAMACLHRRAIGSGAVGDPLMNAPDLFSQHFEFVLEGLTHRPSISFEGGAEHV